MRWTIGPAERQRRGPARVARAARRGRRHRQHRARAAGPLLRRRSERGAAGPAGSADAAGPGRFLPRQRRDSRFRLGGARRHGRHLARALPPHEPRVPRSQARALHGRGPVGLRHGRRRRRALLLSGRPQGLPRPVLLPRPARALRRARRLRPGLRHRPRGRPPRADACSASPSKVADARRSGERSARPTRSRCGWSCRPTASPASGRTTPTSTRHILEQGDIEEALDAATAIGDDRLQRQPQGRVVPESFTHGTSAQRVRWFQRGFETGEVRPVRHLRRQAACSELSAARSP